MTRVFIQMKPTQEVLATDKGQKYWKQPPWRPCSVCSTKAPCGLWERFYEKESEIFFEHLPLTPPDYPFAFRVSFVYWNSAYMPTCMPTPEYFKESYHIDTNRWDVAFANRESSGSTHRRIWRRRWKRVCQAIQQLKLQVIK